MWQRQPRGPSERQATDSSQISDKVKKETETFQISPAHGTVVDSQTITMSGKSEPNSLVLIYSNDTSGVAKTREDGSYQLQSSLEPGLNLLKIIFVSPSGQITQEENLTLYFSQKDVGKTVAAGSVKSIFDNLVTVTTQTEDINIRTAKSTIFDVPKEEDVKEATEEVDNIRIGDYVIATGDASDQDSLIAKNLQVIRTNKPQLTKQMVIAKIASTLRQNIFSAKNNKDAKIIEFTLDKNSEILQDGNEVKSEIITKDKSAIIFYTEDNDTSLIDLIYLLP